MLSSHIVYHLTSSCRHKMVPQHRLEPHQLTFVFPLVQALIGIAERDMFMLQIFNSHLHFQLQALKGIPKAVKPHLLTLQCTLVEREVLLEIAQGDNLKLLIFGPPPTASSILKTVSPQQDHRSSHIGLLKLKKVSQQYILMLLC